MTSPSRTDGTSASCECATPSLWDGEPGSSNLVGGAFWWIGDDGNGGDGIHAPRESGSAVNQIDDTAGNDSDVSEEPHRASDWVDAAYVTPETVRIAPGTYTIEIWANPNGLTPSANPLVPADPVERHCWVEVGVTAGSHLNVFIEDYPSDGGECPHHIEPRWTT